MPNNCSHGEPSVLEHGLAYLADASVLVIDDEPAIVDAIEAILEIDICRANSVAQGMEAFAHNGPFDLVIVDKNLPDGSGLETIRNLRAQCPDQAFILITGYPSMDSAIEAVEAGAFDYVPKPFQLSTLVFKARNAVEKTRQNRHERALVAQLKASEQQHRALFQASSDAILLFDSASGHVKTANHAAALMYGYSVESLIGRSRSALLEEATGTLHIHAEGKDATIVSAIRRDGSKVPVEVSRGETSVDGEDAFVEVIRDLSERVRMQDEREKIAKRLRASEKMEALGQLSAGIAHDFNNLLVVFMGASGEISNWIEDNPEYVNEDIRYASEELCQAIMSSQSLTKQLLGFGQRQLPSRHNLDVAHEIQCVARLLSRTLTERIVVTVAVADDLPLLLMDRGHLEQVLTNLALNARDAMPTGGNLTISATSKLRDNAQAVVVMQVSDTGSGMDEATASRIFDPFFTTKGPEQGTGLGLATVHGIVRSNNGEIRVESTIGAGTTFEITLPCSELEEDAVAEEETLSYRERIGARILVVEDHEQVRTFVERALLRAGYNVACAKNGEDALALVETTPRFDMLLTDEGLPTIQGHELATQLLATHNMKVLCMSAYAAPICSAGSPQFPFLAKPFSANRLLARVHDALGGDADNASML